MKFSYKKIKELVPEIKSREILKKVLNEKIFEVEDVDGDTFDISVPPNRYADSSGHWGIAREISAALGYNFEYPKLKPLPLNKKGKFINVEIKDKKKCLRYISAVFENVKIGPSPKFIVNTLKNCGIQSINNVVDILNYVMIEVGQPLHALDAGKLYKNGNKYKLVVRNSKYGEKLETLDGKKLIASGKELVISDNKDVLAIAGIKGCKKAEIDGKTNKIIVESALFDSLSVYSASRNIGITTDASLRFSRKLSPILAEIGMKRAKEFLEKYADAILIGWSDTNRKEFSKRVVLFNIEKFEKFSGISMHTSKITDILYKLGFKIIINKKYNPEKEFLVEAPSIRVDIEEFEDVAEEIVRMYGLNLIKPKSPNINIKPAKIEDIILIKDRIKDEMVKLGFSEVYTSSFMPEGYAYKYNNLIEIKSPPSIKYQYLRESFLPKFIKVSENNLKYFNEAKIFEIGEIFLLNDKNKAIEKTSLGISIASKNDKNAFFQLKGAVVELLKSLGITDWNFILNESEKENKKEIYVMVGDKKIGSASMHNIGDYLLSYAEIDVRKLLNLEEGEYEYMPIPKFPAVERDISLIMSKNQKIGDIINEIQLLDLSIIRDVDLIDEYDIENEKNIISITLRIVFQSDIKTLTDNEVNNYISKIYKMLKSKFNVKERV